MFARTIALKEDRAEMPVYGNAPPVKSDAGVRCKEYMENALGKIKTATKKTPMRS